jgi:hypothetical protein
MVYLRGLSWDLFCSCCLQMICPKLFKKLMWCYSRMTQISHDPEHDSVPTRAASSKDQHAVTLFSSVSDWHGSATSSSQQARQLTALPVHNTPHA